MRSPMNGHYNMNEKLLLKPTNIKFFFLLRLQYANKRTSEWSERSSEWMNWTSTKQNYFYKKKCWIQGKYPN